MIPKKIHFCWLSGDQYPPLIKYCIETWKEFLPDYEIVLWDTKRFDITSVSWVQEAFTAKKYAFAADYIRLYAVYTQGGIYLDSDVEVLKTFNDLLKHKEFIGFEAATENVEAAIFGAEPGCEWCRKAMEFYHDKHFVTDENGGVDLAITAPIVAQTALVSVYPDFPEQAPTRPVTLSGSSMTVYPSDYFSPIKHDLEKSYSSEKDVAKHYRSNPRTYCIHRFTASWGIKPTRKVQLWDFCKKQLEKIFGKRVSAVILKPVRILTNCCRILIKSTSR